MKPIMIKDVLNLAWDVRKNGDVFTPLFTGDAGLGKSEIIQQWAADMDEKYKDDGGFKYIDLRIAYMEAPDFIGFPETDTDDDGKKRTCHFLPEFWPTKGRGILVFEEPNRGTTGVMNCLMQILTDRAVHNYKLPEGWVMAAAINPDSAEYDVNAMDAALRNRFEEYEIEYDHNSFVNYIESKQWNNNITMFVKSGAWVYKSAQQIGRDGKYISPRTWSKVNASENADLSKKRQMHFMTISSVLGKDIGKEYHKFCFDEAPVLANDLLESKKKALAKLKKQSGGGDSYKGDMVAMTIESIIKNYSCKEEDDNDAGKIGEKTMAAVAKIIPSDQALNLIKECGWQQSKGSIIKFFKEFTTRHPDLIDVLKSHITVSRSAGK